MATKNIKKILLNKDGDNFVADIENIENRITQNSSNLETAKQELSDKCNEALSQAKAYTDQEKAKLFNSTDGTFTGQEYFRNSDSGELRFNGGNTHDGGASLMLYAKNDVYSGHFNLVACTKEDASDAKQFTGRPDGSLTWNGKNIVRSVNGQPADKNGNVSVVGILGSVTGEIKWFAFNTVPDGYLVCNGANVSRTTYADLFAVIGTTFGSGDGSTTFALPNLIDKFAQGSTTVGTVKSAGLPNITGNLFLEEMRPTDFAKGAFYIFAQNQTPNTFRSPGPGSNFDFAFDASRSNSIYGNSTTVQPPALTLLPCIKY